MDLLSWALFALAATGALAVVLHLYRRREAPGRGRVVLAGLRWSSLVVLLLLLFDPQLPVAGLAVMRERTQILLDASLSMTLPVSPGDTTSRWQAATRDAARLAGRAPVLLFGARARRVAADSLGALEPTATSSRLLPALQAASEAGMRRVVVLTDGGIDDAAEVRRMLPQLGLDVEVRPVTDGAVANRAVAEVDAPAWAEAGEPVRIRAGIAAAGPVGDSVTVELRQGGRVLATARAPSPARGRVAEAVLEFEPEAPEGGGLVRYDVALAGSDAAPDDDVRSVYVQVGERPAGITLVSLRPDWEPRFLLPVLDQSLGLPIRGYLRAADGRYIELGAGEDAGRQADEAAVRRAVADADLVVLHGLGQDAPAWAQQAARNARRLLIFPAGDASVPALPVTLPPATAGEWYATDDVPASPVAPLLASMSTAGLPPLTGLRPIVGLDGVWAPLEASRGGHGQGAPVVVAGEADGRRWAVATADGYWRWAFRGGEARQAYRRLWSALGGWLVEEEFAAADAAVRPVRRTAPRGEAIAWIAPGLEADSIAVRITDAAGTVATDTTVTSLRGDSAYTAALAPGHYRYEARAFSGGKEVGAAEGPLSVESYSPEFLRAAAAVEAFDAASGEPETRSVTRAGVPLHSLPWVYVALVLLLSTEWVLRRRWGLR
ncbi:MAG TPA: VWA domain-containing protein [Longimicrobiales bacterium]